MMAMNDAGVLLNHRATTPGELIRIYRLTRKVSQNDLARRSGLSQNALSNLELHGKQPERKTLLRVADALGLTRAETDALLLIGGLSPTDETVATMLKTIERVGGPDAVVQ